MHHKLRHRPSAAIVVASIALFVALAGSAVAAGVVPLAKRALVADNAKKFGGQTPAQLTATAAAQPGPASSAAALVTVKSANWSLTGGQGSDYSTPCDPGQKAIGGGYDNPTGTAISIDNRPSADGGSWQLYLQNVDNSAPASGTLYAVCLK